MLVEGQTVAHTLTQTLYKKLTHSEHTHTTTHTHKLNNYRNTSSKHISRQQSRDDEAR